MSEVLQNISSVSTAKDETKPRIRCGRRSCGWVGTWDELLDKELPDRPIKTYQRVCPRCGGKGFAAAKPDEKSRPLPLRLVSVKEELPDDEMQVLCCNPLSEDYEIAIRLAGQWYKANQLPFPTALQLIVWEVTHWMDLPTYQHI